MDGHAVSAAAPPPELMWRPEFDVVGDVRTLWGRRELVRLISERDLRARYKQSFLGFVWAVFTPFVTVVLFTVFFKRIGQIDTGDAPYPLFAYLGLLPWTFTSTSIGNSLGSLLANRPILLKADCPREVFPIAGTVSAGIDGVIALAMLGVLFVWYGIMPAATSAWVPVILVVQVMFTLGVALGTSVVVVFARDLRYVIGAALQFGLLLTPVAYSVDEIPAQWRSLYAAINPLVAFIEGYRSSILDGHAPSLALMVPATVTSVIALVGGYALFRRLEGGIADVL